MTKTPKTLVCPICGKTFTPEAMKQKYCTYGCRMKGDKLRWKRNYIKRKNEKG